jgi:hypothetical protein
MGDMMIIQMGRKNIFTKWGEKNEHEMGNILS